MCLGVAGRGDLDEEDWLGVRTEDEEEESSDDEDDEDELIDEIDHDTFSLEEDDSDLETGLDKDGPAPLSQWEGEQLIATKCSNVGAIIEWVVVPFIVEDYDPEGTNGVETEEDEEEL
jgi:hypothetical protein